MELPPAPPLGTLRLATPDDIPRIGIVATAAFRYSPLFTWKRPYHTIYPEDTLLSYTCEFVDAIRDPECIVLVAVDQYDPNEAQQSEAIIPSGNGFQPPAPGSEVIVGAACWKLEPGSLRIGHFQGNGGTFPDLPSNPNRDQNPERVRRWSTLAHEAEQRLFHGISTMEKAVVHPAYWRRGHGATLVRWGMELARIDHIKQGVIAAEMGEKLYSELGYRLLEELKLDGDVEAPYGVSCVAMDYTPPDLYHN